MRRGRTAGVESPGEPPPEGQPWRAEPATRDPTMSFRKAFMLASILLAGAAAVCSAEPGRANGSVAPSGAAARGGHGSESMAPASGQSTAERPSAVEAPGDAAADVVDGPLDLRDGTIDGLGMPEDVDLNFM